MFIIKEKGLHEAIRLLVLVTTVSKLFVLEILESMQLCANYLYLEEILETVQMCKNYWC